VGTNGLGTLEDNDITGNARSGVVIMSGGNPTLRNNRVNQNGIVGIGINDGARGRIEDNDLSGNQYGAWRISKDSNVTRERNNE
jgi:parallel beta-helix repeat protein